MITQRSKPRSLAGLEAVLFSLAFACAQVAHAQQPIALRHLHPRNQKDATNNLANAWQQAQQMKYDPTAWPGAAPPKTSGPSPLVATLNTNNWEWLGPGNIGGRKGAAMICTTPPPPHLGWRVGGGGW